MEILELLEQDINNIINKNTSKLQMLYIDLFNSECKRDIASINNQINYIRNNVEVLDLISKAHGVNNIHDYKMLSDINYKMKHTKKEYNNNCPNCNSYNIIDDNGQITCTKCGSVIGYKYITGYKEKENYNKYINNIYKRKTYVKILINKKLNDLSYSLKEQIINEINNILFQFNKTNKNRRKSFFSYSYMFRYVLDKLKLYDYIDRFKKLKTRSILKVNEEFYSTLN
jgi:transcription elongation factor Elf1